MVSKTPSGNCEEARALRPRGFVAVDGTVHDSAPLDDAEVDYGEAWVDLPEDGMKMKGGVHFSVCGNSIPRETKLEGEQQNQNKVFRHRKRKKRKGARAPLSVQRETNIPMVQPFVRSNSSHSFSLHQPQPKKQKKNSINYRQ